MNKNNSSEPNIRLIFISVIIIYAALVVAFYFLAGEQLHIRESRSNFSIESETAGAIELQDGVLIEQEFTTTIQRLESISVQAGTYYRENHGTITIALVRKDNDEILMQGIFNATEVTEGQKLVIEAEEPVETVYDAPLLLRISSDSCPGEAVGIHMTSNMDGDAFRLFVNGSETSDVLCFSVYGTEYIWIGLHYWQFTIAFGIILAVILVILWARYRHGKNSRLITTIYAFHKYRFLIQQIVSRDFKTKYKRSLLGVFWSFLNPLLMMLVQYFVFSTLFKNDIPNYAAYLLTGVVIFNFFSEACGLSLTSILENSNLITKVYMPKYIYPVTRVLSSVINLAISFIPLMIVFFVTGEKLQKSVILSLFFFACLIIFSLGLGLLLSTSMVFFRDTKFLWGVLSMMWMYATPIFYPESILPEQFLWVQRLNPLYYYVKNTRICLLDGISPEPRVYVQCLLISLGMLLVGALVFRKNQDKFVFYL